MKKTILTLVAIFAMTLQTNAISYTQAREEALFLTDKMAYELGLSQVQYDAVYEINLDYMMALGSSSDISGTYWTRRNLDLSYVLSATQYNKYKAASYFYRPVSWSSGWKYNIYSRYTNRSLFYYGKPTVYTTYSGAHSWRNNGNKSWYKGRTFDSKKVMTPVKTGTQNKTVTNRTVTGGNKNTTVKSGSSSGSWRNGSQSSVNKTSTTTNKPSNSTSGKKPTGTVNRTTTNTNNRTATNTNSKLGGRR